MKEAVHSFILAANQLEHILPLIRQADFHVAISTHHETVKLAINHGTIEISDDLAPGYTINGSNAGIHRLISGEAKLRTLQREGVLKVEAPLRIVLLLEALFVLASSQNFAKIS
ncbi:hypothetical protein [Neobacillus sp. LXY-1]|uniref:hypothetical protein n=1 Tax=Neobacillus sp. LXY-1 TaxID=3379133 RepID=UPI003EDEAF4E